MIYTKAIIPSPFKSSVFRQEIQAEMDRLRDGILDDFARTTKTWTHKPTFAGGVSLKGSNVTLEVKTDDEIYGYVTEGTRPHLIRPRKASRLMFKSGYKAKTIPKVISSQAGGAFGATRFARLVRHPGTKARKFHETIARDWRPTFKKSLQIALNRAAKRSGHGG